MLPCVAFSGPFGSGKTTCADAMTRALQYQQLNFATPLKQLVIEADPLVSYWTDEYEHVPIHLSDVMSGTAAITFEEAKREYPEVRRSLQRIGQGARKIDPEFWVNIFKRRMADIPTNTPVVVADMRYENEAYMLRCAGFMLIRIERPGLVDSAERQHVTETALRSYPHDHVINNMGSKAELISQVFDLLL
jgi:DNA polymerase III delta prime subunit